MQSAYPEPLSLVVRDIGSTPGARLIQLHQTLYDQAEESESALLKHPIP